jgi:hypothetical protein
MNLLEQLIAQQVSASVVGTLSRATEKIADQMAQEILKEPEFRRHMRELVKRAFAQAITNLAQPAPAPTAAPSQPNAHESIE